MKKSVLLIAIFAFICLSGCADTQTVDACVTGNPYGFWYGLWHGIIIVFAFIISLFDHSVTIYAVHNNGAFYNLGFVVGISILGGGVSKSS